MMKQFFVQLTLVCTALTLLSSCTSMQSTSSTSTDANARMARQLSSKGDHLGASRAYLDLAVAATEDTRQRQRYLIFSAAELYLDNDLEGCERILQEIGDDIDPSNLELWAQIKGELLLAQDNPAGALEALNQVTSSENKAAAERILLLRARALFQLDRPEAAVATLLQREAILDRRKDVLNNQRQIWMGLQRTGGSIPPDAAMREGDVVLNGWLDLGYVAYLNRASLTGLSTTLEQWRTLNPDHPASDALLDEVLEGLSILSNYPERVALLLPLSGRQKTVGQAIRDGYLAAHFSIGENAARPEINVYDTHRLGVEAAYKQAILGGADFVIGPLLKSEVAEIATLGDDLTVLALNFGPDDTDYPKRFYQFALAPEDEAREAANRAADNGQLNAVVLVPESDWGNRIQEAFRTELERRGGKILAARSYATDTADYAEVIRDVLLLDESYGRRNRLASNIGKDLEFKPRRRQDVDLVFIAANPANGKLLRPQLRFHYAADLPTYATSAIYRPGTSDNADINGVMFPDMPWLLDPTRAARYDQDVLRQYWGANSARLARLHAMGYDAYHLSAILNNSRTVKKVDMQGMTGDLYIDRDGRLHRRLRWAKMERGQPRTLPEAQRSLMQDAEIIVR